MTKKQKDNTNKKVQKFWASKDIDGYITVQPYTSFEELEKAYRYTKTAKVILPFKANDLKEAAIKVGNKLENGRFILMDRLESGLEIPRRYYS